MTQAVERATPRARTTGSGWFRAFWRWHFYASFLVVPVLLVLATTGLIYLFRFQLEPLLHADLMKVEQPADVDIRQPYAGQLAAVERKYPDASVVSMTEPRDDNRSTVFSVVEPDGAVRDVYVDPWGAEVLGDLDPDTTLSGYAVRLHGELMASTWGERLVELAACWAIVMALTGYYLFVKGRAARLRRRTSGAAGAALRSRHGMVGAAVGLGLLTLLVSGLPWTGFWGAKAQVLATERGQSMWSTDPGALSDPVSRLDESLPHSHAHEVPWGLGGSPVPDSTVPDSTGPNPNGPHSARGDEVSVANIDTAVEVAEREGLRHPMTVALPGGSDDTGVFSVIGYAFDAPSDEKTVHVDRYGGTVVATYGFDDYPALAKVVSQGIGLHEGRSLGLWSFWGAALLCSAVIFTCVSGPLMWWCRRPSGAARLGAPRGRLPLRGSPALLVGLVGLGLFLPLFGLSVVAILTLDQLVVRRVRALEDFFSAV